MKYVCPICGYPEMTQPAYDEYDCCSWDICPSCGVEFGYHDATRSHETLRQQWLEKGAEWYSAVTAPPWNWNPQAQLEAAGFVEEAGASE